MKREDKVKSLAIRVSDGNAYAVKKEKIYKDMNDKLVEDTVKLFEPINMGVQKLYGNKTERRDVLVLHRQLGDKLPKVIGFLPTYNASIKPNKAGKVFGRVLKPSELLRNLQEVFDAKRRLDRQLEYEMHKEAILKKEREDAEALKRERDAYTLEQKAELKRRSDDMLRTIRGF